MSDTSLYLSGEPKSAMRRCGICNQGPMFNWARRIGQVCVRCEERAVDSKGQKILIAQLLKDEGGSLYVQSPKAYFRPAADGQSLPDCPCDEVNVSGSCWIDGIPCLIWEGRFGGVGLVVCDISNQPMVH